MLDLKHVSAVVGEHVGNISFAFRDGDVVFGFETPPVEGSLRSAMWIGAKPRRSQKSSPLIFYVVHAGHP